MILVLGANGQVGGALARMLGAGCLAWDSAEINLSGSLSAMEKQMDGLAPSAVINAAAYTQVDKAESEPELAAAVNTRAPGFLARWCAARGIPFVHYSTDYVFDGSGTAAHREDDPTGPLSVYGATKLAGEQAVAAAGGKFLIFRTSWVYDETGKNFLNTMLRLGLSRGELHVVADQHGAPTYAAHLAEATLAALGTPGFTPGVYHLCNAGETTWHGFAEAIFAAAKAAGLPLKVERVTPIRTQDYPTPARRPQNSRLSCEKAARLLGLALPAWQEGLAACMRKKL